MKDESTIARPAGEEVPPFNLTEVDRWVLSLTDEEFEKHDWENLKDVIANNRLETFKRTPSSLRAYISWTRDIKAQYGSMSAYILAKRLPREWGQPPFAPASNVPLADPSDYKVLINDWPYGMADGIVHLVVWSRTPIPTDDVAGDVTPESRALINEFVQRYFVDELKPDGKDRVAWFKNWVSLQSVRALEHFHVLVRDVDDATLLKWTGESPRRP